MATFTGTSISKGDLLSLVSPISPQAAVRFQPSNIILPTELFNELRWVCSFVYIYYVNFSRMYCKVKKKNKHIIICYFLVKKESTIRTER